MIDLREYWTPLVKNTGEFRKIAKAENPEIETMWKSLENAARDQFILTLTINGVKRWERLLKITPKANYTLEDRRFVILTRLNEQLPYTVGVLKQILSQLCGKDGYTLTVNHDEYAVDILVELKSKNQADEVKILTRKMLPANLLVSVRIRYNQYKDVQQHTHQALFAYTHYQIRNEVVN